MNKKHIKICRLVLAAVLTAVGMFVPLSEGIKLAVFLAAYLAAGYDVLWRACRNIAHGQIFDENFLMTVATVGALFIKEFPEAVAVMVFYQAGEMFEHYAVDRSRRSISSLMSIRPDFADVIRDGKTVRVSPEEVVAGEIITVTPGERIPLDGVIVSGDTTLDTSALTGESVPRKAAPGDDALSGCVNLSAVLTVKVTHPFEESTVSRILEMVEEASDRKSRSESFITRFAAVYTPVVVGAAVLIAVLPPLITGQPFEGWIYRALSFLVVSCPCALVISVPLSFFGGIGGASKAGVLIKGGNYLEALAKADIVVMDKTGTLTKGVFEVQRIDGQERALELAAYAENFSTHPISSSLKKAYGKDIDESRLSDVREIAGRGVSAVLDGSSILAGSARLMRENGIECPVSDDIGTVVYVAENGSYIGRIVVADAPKPDAADAIKKLRDAGIKKTVMLTGDTKAAGEAVAKQLGLDAVYTGLLPADKVARLEELESEGTVAFAGDGINDAPVLARADVGIAMGGLGADAAIEAADVIIMTDEPSKIALAIHHCRRTLAIARQNIAFALIIKAAVLVLVTIGTATMWEAVFADVGVSFIAILNALRALKVKN